MTRQDFINGLREAADFFEANPELPVPPYSLYVNVFVDKKEDMQNFARLGSWKKSADSKYFYLNRSFANGVSYYINIDREEICERVVVGTEIIPARPAQPEQIVEKVEWKCNPIFEGEV